MHVSQGFAPLDRGVRLVYQTGCFQYASDTSMPFVVHVVLRPPEFMEVAWAFLHGGSEEIVARAESLAGAEDFLKRNELEQHPRFRRLVITGPDDLRIERSR